MLKNIGKQAQNLDEYGDPPIPPLQKIFDAIPHLIKGKGVRCHPAGWGRVWDHFVQGGEGEHHTHQGFVLVFLVSFFALFH